MSKAFLAVLVVFALLALVAALLGWRAACVALGLLFVAAYFYARKRLSDDIES